MKNRLLALMLSLVIMVILAGCGGNSGASSTGTANTPQSLADLKMDVGTAPGPPTYPLAYLAEQNPNINLKPWQNNEQLLAMLSSKEVQISSCPISNALIAYNKGLDVKVLNVSVWGMLYVLTTENDIKSLQDLKGKEIAVSGQNQLHDLILRHLLKKNGIDPDKDVTLTYLDMSQISTMLATGQLKYAVLNEPNSSIAVLNSKKNGIALNRVLDLTDEWHKLPGQDKVRLPMGCIVVIGGTNITPEQVAVFEKSYMDAAEWVNNHPDEIGPIVEKHVSWMKGPAVTQSIQFARLNPQRATECKAEIEAFFNELSTTTDPKAFGGKLPDAGFYYQAQ